LRFESFHEVPPEYGENKPVKHGRPKSPESWSWLDEFGNLEGVKPRQERLERLEKLERGLEAFWHGESNTLLIPRPPGAKNTAEAMALMSVPVVEFIDKLKPDIVIGNDRGGRLFSVAVKRMYKEIKDGSFPTADGKLHFGRFSKSLPISDAEGTLLNILERSAKQALISGKDMNGEKLSVLIIDDWVASGKTRRIIEKAIDNLGLSDIIELSFAVMSGEGADASGSDSGTDINAAYFADKEDVIGVGYEGAYPYPVRTKGSQRMREAIISAVKDVGAAIAA